MHNETALIYTNESAIYKLSFLNLKKNFIPQYIHYDVCYTTYVISTVLLAWYYCMYSFTSWMNNAFQSLLFIAYYLCKECACDKNEIVAGWRFYILNLFISSKYGMDASESFLTSGATLSLQTGGLGGWNLLE